MRDGQEVGVSSFYVNPLSRSATFASRDLPMNHTLARSFPWDPDIRTENTSADTSGYYQVDVVLYTDTASRLDESCKVPRCTRAFGHWLSFHKKSKQYFCGTAPELFRYYDDYERHFEFSIEFAECCWGIENLKKRGAAIATQGTRLVKYFNEGCHSVAY
jgi:hypothetical protein